MTINNNMINLPIGLFDSGFGGLTVLSKLQQELPEEKFLYFADTKRLPYGAKNKDFICEYTIKSAKKLLEEGIKALVIACNTATAAALDELKKTFPDVIIVGVIDAGASAAAMAAPKGNILLLATESTVRSQVYNKKINELAPEAFVNSIACPLLVNLAEEGWVESGSIFNGNDSDLEDSKELNNKLSVADLAVARYILEGCSSNSSESFYPNKCFKDDNSYLAKSLTTENKSESCQHVTNKGIDALILGCTHFSLFLDSIIKSVSKSTKIIDPAEGTAKAVKKILLEKGLASNSNKVQESCGLSQVKFLVTSDPEHFIRIGGKLLKSNISSESVSLVFI